MSVSLLGQNLDCMNFENMPELSWRFGYPLCLLVIAGLCGYVYTRFKKSGWL